MFENVTGVVLAGGDSSRMGHNKAAVEFNGLPLIKKTVGLFKKLFPEVIVVSRKSGKYGELGCREVCDILPQKGAMIGILTGLSASGTDYIFTAACDMPFIKEEVISLIVSKGTGYHVGLPEVSGTKHPLHALYSKKCYDLIIDFINRGDKSLIRFIESLPPETVRPVTEEEIRRVDPEAISVFNMNTPAELEFARNLLTRHDN